MKDYCYDMVISLSSSFLLYIYPQNFVNSAYYRCLLINFANSLDQDQARQNVRPDLDPNCLTLKVVLKEFFEKDDFEQICNRQKSMQNSPVSNELTKLHSDLGDNCVLTFHLGRYIVGYMVGNLVDGDARAEP